MSNYPPSPKGDPILGHFRAFRKNSMAFMRSSVQSHGDFILFRLLNKKVYMISDADLAKYVMQTNNKNYHKSPGYKPLRLLVGNGTFTSEGEFWLQQRRLYQPAFAKKRIELYSTAVIESSAKLAADWAERSANNQDIDGSSEMMELTMDIIGQTLFSTNLGERADEVYAPLSIALDYINKRALQAPFVWPANWPVPPNNRFKKAVKKLDEIVYGMIDQRKQTGEMPDDLLTTFLTHKDEVTGQTMNPLQVRDECMTLFLAGHESTANVLSWFFIELARHPEVQQKLQAEIDAAIGKEKPTFPDLMKLPYMVQVLNETMRLYPPIWHLGRMNLEADELDGYAIPPKSHIRISPLTIQRNPKYWEDADRFDPDRFAPANKDNIYPGSFIPFGNGPRLCVGRNFAMMEMGLIVATLYQQFEIGVKNPDQIQMDPLLTLRPDRRVLLQLKPR